MSTRYGQHGLTLIELIAFIVIVSVGLTGILAALNATNKSSADPLQPKQALAIAESLLDEILAKDYCDPDLPGAIGITGNITAANNAVSGIASTTGISVGWQLVGSGLPGNVTVTATTPTTLTLSANALASAAGVAFQAAKCEDAEAARTGYDNVRDYNGFSEAAATMLDGTTFAGYDVAVSVPAATVAINGVDMRQVTVTVTAPNGTPYALTGYRAPY